MRRAKRKILVAVDGSDQSYSTARYLARLIPGDGVKVTLFHVMDWVPDALRDLEVDPGELKKLVQLRAWRARQKEVCAEFMQRVREVVRDSGYDKEQVAVVVRARKVGIARDIAAEARKGYDALVVGRWGCGQLKDLFLGSTANKLVNHVCELPVCVVGGRPEMTRILVAMDGSDGSLRTLDYVTGYLGLLYNEMLLFHVIRRLELGGVPGGRRSTASSRTGEWLQRVRGDALQIETSLMQSLFDRRIQSLQTQGAGPGSIRTKILTGAVSRAGSVVDEADQGGYGTIVIGRKGRSQVGEFLLGRVSSKVIQLARDQAAWVVN